MPDRMADKRRGSAAEGLQASLLGRPALSIDGHAIAPQLGAKPRGLLYYLLTESPSRVSRAQAAALFWGEDETSRVSLRQALARLRRWIGDTIVADADGVSLNLATPLSCDLHRLRDAMRDVDALPGAVLVEVCHLYRGEFLEGLDLRATEAFEQWLRTLRERTRRDARFLCERAIARLVADDRPEEAIHVAYRWVEIDEADEIAHTTLMRLLAEAGRRTAAIAQYETCRRILRDVLGARPSAATFALYTRIHADMFAPDSSVADAVSVRRNGSCDALPDRATEVAEGGSRDLLPDRAPGIPENDSLVAPRDPSPVSSGDVPLRVRSVTEDFVFHEDPLFGRERELVRARAQLDDRDCRLLTLLGPGGIGKTRLVLALARSICDRFDDGAILVRGAEVPTGDDSITALVDAIALQCGRRLDGALDPARALAHALSGKRLLIVLDALESFPHAGTLLTALLGGADGVRVLTTSQQRVGAGREWLFELRGLSLEHEPGRLSAAATLFGHEACRLRHDFDPLDEQSDLEAVCAWLEGVPLALQMAAQGVRQGNCAMLLERLKSDATLIDPERAEADRHRSMQAVIDAAWQRLEPALQTALTRLASLPAAFGRKQALSIAAVSDEALGQLIDRCWLRVDKDGLFRLHGLHRRALQRHTESTPVTDQRQAKALADWWIDTLSSSSDRIPSTPAPVLARLALAQLRDIVDALADVQDRPRLEALLEAGPGLLNEAGAGREAAAMLERGSRAGVLSTAVRGLLLMRAALLHNLAGDTVNAWELLPRAIESLELAGDSPLAFLRTVRALRRGGHLASPLLNEDRARQDILLGLMSLAQMRAIAGDSAGSARVMLILREISRVHRDPRGLALCDATLCYLGGDYGHPPGTRWFARRAARRAPRPDDDLVAAVAALTRAVALYSAGEWLEALMIVQPLIAAFESFGAGRWMFESRSLVAKIRFAQGQIILAEQSFDELFELASARGHRGGLIWGGVGRAEVALRTGTIAPAALVGLLERIELDIYETQITDPAYTIRHLGARAVALARLGEWQEARQVALAGAAALRRIDRCGSWAHEGFGSLLETLLACSEHDDGRDDAVLKVAIADTCRRMRRHCRVFPPGMARYLLCLGTCHRLLGRTARARRALGRATAIAVRYDMRLDLARAYELDARWSSSDGTGEPGRSLLERALQTYRACGAEAEVARLAHSA